MEVLRDVGHYGPFVGPRSSADVFHFEKSLSIICRVSANTEGGKRERGPDRPVLQDVVQRF